MELRKNDAVLTSAVLMEKYIQAVFSRKEAELERDRIRLNTPSGSRYVILPKAVREILTICVAWRMSGLGLKNTIPRAEVVEMVRELYEPLMLLSISNQVEPGIAEGLIILDKRLQEETLADRVEAIAAEVCSAGLLVSDPVGGATNLRFPHKQFFEFLIAKGIAITTHNLEFVASDLLKKASNQMTLSRRIRSEINSLFYLIEMIGPEVRRIMNPISRFLVQIIVFNSILISDVKSIFQRTEAKDFEEQEMKNNLLAVSHQESVFMYKNRREISENVTVIMFLITLFGIYLIVVSVTSAIDGGFKGGIVALWFLLTLTPVLFALNTIFYSEKNVISTCFLFIDVAWSKEQFFPDSRRRALLLTYGSIVQGWVQYDVPIETDVPYEQFLYPAKEFGIVSR